MSRQIFCTYLKRIAEGQDFRYYPGELGERIYNEISKEAWQIWMLRQTVLINERKNSTINPKDRKELEEEMVGFLF
jgi:Fe-S cluster biosynthesis and repair protein YggX